MMDLVLYGNYYKVFKGNGGIPQKNNCYCNERR